MTTWTKENKKKPHGSKCECKTKGFGVPCENYAMPNGRCWLHGGRIVPPAKGSMRALKHGLYAKGMLEDEKALLPDVKLGTLDDELVMLKLKLRRAYIAQKLWIQQRQQVTENLEAEMDDMVSPRKPVRRLARTIEDLEKVRLGITDFFHIGSIETTRSTMHDQEGNPHTNYSKKFVKKKEDYSQEIRALTKLISHLEMRRKELLTQSEDTLKNLVKGFRDFADLAEQTLPGGGQDG